MGFWLSATSLIVAIAGVSISTGSGVAAASTGGTVHEVSVPGGYGGLRSVSCTSPGDCTAVGWASNQPGAGGNGPNGDSAPMYVTESNGTWGTPTVLSGYPIGQNYLFGVSCTSATDCTAVGDQTGGPIYYATESGGTWGPVQEISGLLPGFGGILTSVSCTSATDCTAVGFDGQFSAPMYVTESGGTWGSVHQLSGSQALLTSVSCTSATDCTAVGWNGNNNLEGVYVTESGGTWGPVQPLLGSSEPFSVSCTSATDCTALSQTLSGQGQGGYVSEVDGTWGTPTQINGVVGFLYGVSCTTATDCTAVSGATDSPGYVSESGGIWGSGQLTSGAPQIQGASNYLFSVSCTSATDCAAVGGGADSQPIVADVGPTATVLIAPSTLPATPGPVSYTATVTGAGPTPTGSVTISDGQGGSCSINPLVSGSGSCTISESVASGPYTITGTYSGDSNYLGATATINVASSVAVNGTATTGSDGVTATATGGTDGVDTVTETQYTSDPVSASTGTSGSFFDEVLSPGNTFTGDTINDCNLNGGTTLVWWNPSADSGDGAWEPVIGDPGPTYTEGPPSCISVTLDNTTSPSLSQLTGTVFGAVKLGITTTSLPAGTVGAQYTTTTLTAIGGNPPYTWKLAKGSKLPKGLKLNKVTGAITGTPTKKSKSSTFTVEVLDKKVKVKHHSATQNTATATFSITIVNTQQALRHVKRR